MTLSFTFVDSPHTKEEEEKKEELDITVDQPEIPAIT